MPRFAMTYVIYWPEHGVLKVGRAWKWSRVQALTETGGQVLVLARGTDASWERHALRVLRRWFPQAFTSEVRAWSLMPYGRGWTECFAVGEAHVQLAVDLCFEGFARGNEQGRNEATDDHAGRPDVAGVHAAPHEAKVTAQGLWLHTDLTGRRELVPELIAAAIYPGQPAVEMVIEHVLMLEESGFLRTYPAEGSEWIELCRPLRADTRTAPPSECPPPPSRDMSRHVVAVEGERVSARERAEARVRAEEAERAGEWAAWREQRERPARPSRPLLLDAPPIGCTDHPNGRREDCGPCGTARRQHDRWVAQQRYTEQLTRWEESADEPGEEW